MGQRKPDSLGLQSSILRVFLKATDPAKMMQTDVVIPRICAVMGRIVFLRATDIRRQGLRSSTQLWTSVPTIAVC